LTLHCQFVNLASFLIQYSPMNTALDFTITHHLGGTLARAGVIHTPHGDIETPAFIVGGTKATVKAITPEQVREYGGQAILANTYHLMLRPGSDIIKTGGGLGKFMNWSGPTSPSPPQPRHG
jgi:queuine tRNA-ribosyltransferase